MSGQKTKEYIQDLIDYYFVFLQQEKASPTTEISDNETVTGIVCNICCKGA
ncbi:hypothetical protein M23134_05826 [Microscilla marina ATCC 23134]|uniref:Uncharacterized protein n=1 Tax=Microscilla marina ATCC 23134 TaxID=313606 RepID=A1ZIT5_MICM2|nr:hypothetical protein M23134_05826 [Microscilla marina ATCC 23134]